MATTRLLMPYGGFCSWRAMALVTAMLSEPTLAIREHEDPAWRVDFADESNSSFYISQATGRLLERRNDTWRIWDVFWMLHNMDYANRTSFNHPLVVTAAFGAALAPPLDQNFHHGASPRAFGFRK